MEPTLDVIVIGAGTAGLATARELADGGKKVVVVEARDRIGGRMFTDHTSMSVPVELGCHYIHGPTASTWDLVHKLGLKTHQDNMIATREQPGGPWKKTIDDDPRPLYQNFRVIGGYNQILAPLADKLTIQLNTVVKRVEYSSTGVSVNADKKGRPVTYKARAAVVAIPVAVLAADTIEFSPPLAPAKVEAFKSLPQEPIMKVVMEFDHPVIPEDADVVRDADVPWYLFNGSTEEPGYSGQVFVVGAEMEEATRLLALPRERRHEEVLTVIRDIAGDPRLRPLKILEHEWAKDPFARGAYSQVEFPSENEIYIPGQDVIHEPSGDSLYWAGVITPSVDISRDHGKEVAGTVLQRLGRK